MPDPIDQFGKDMGDGSFASGAIQLPDGSWAELVDGAPCCCGPEGCWLVVLACNCRNLRLARVLDLNSPGLDAAWPYQDRRAGVVVSIGGVCYQFMAATTTYPTGLDPISWADFDGITYDSCSESPCSTQPPCDCDLGFVWTMSNGVYPNGLGFACLRSFSVCGIERIDASFTRSVFVSYEDVDDNEIEEGLVTVSASGVIEEVGNAPLTTSLSGSGRTTGRNTFRNPNQQWDVSQTYTDDDLADTSVALSFINALNRPSPGASLLRELVDAPPGTRTGEGWPQSDAGSILCCCTIRDSRSGPESYTLVSHSSASMTLTGFKVDGYHQFDSFFEGSPRVRRRRRVSVSASLRYTLVGGIVIEDEDCDRPPPMIARACSIESDPQEITYDPIELPSWAVTLRPVDRPDLYVPTNTESSDEPIPTFAEDQSCPDDPNPDDVYRINICNSTTRAGGGVVQGDTLIPKVIGYRPGDGLQPGEGMVWANIPTATGSGNVCLRRVACQPTTQVVTDAEIEYTSVAGNCRGQPVSNVDPRPGCSQVDGGGGVGPSDTLGINAPQDPALQAELARQAQMRTGQFPGRCPSCGG